jgi:hypothetical protein
MQTSIAIRIRRLGTMVCCLAAVVLSAAETRPKLRDVGAPVPASALYIGNSFFYYNNGLHGHVRGLLAEGWPEFRHRATSVTISGSGLDWHDVESYFRPNAIGRYSFGAGNEIRFNQNERLFDVAIMMDCSQCPLHPELGGVFTEFARKHSATVRSHGARPVFFMSWAYQDKPEMTAQLAEAYTRAGNDNNAFVIPAGLAFARSILRKPDLNLYVADKRHPSLAGTYLAACTTYAALFRKSPVGLTYNAGLPPETARHLQTVAWETVQEYFRP